jgi:ParB family chromosome partitioning protein
MKDKKLGRGLDSLFHNNDGEINENTIEIRDNQNTISQSQHNLLTIDLDNIKPNKNQPRKYFDTLELEELTKTIKTDGIVQPILVRQIDNYYEIIAGERRWRAAQKAGLKTIPAILIVADDEKSTLISLIENIHRTDLNPIEKALSFKDLIERTKCTQEELSIKLGIDRSTLANFIRLLELPKEIQDNVSRGTISMGHARALLGINNEKVQLSLLNRSLKGGLSVRKIEQIIRNYNIKSSQKTPSMKDPLYNEIENKLTEFFGTKVSIFSRGKKTRIILDFYENSQINGFLNKLNITI